VDSFARLGFLDPPTRRRPAPPPERFPPRLAELGFQGRVINGVDVILPPLCEVSAGEFLMGSDPKQDAGAQQNEQPQHRVTLAVYHIARHPVTVAEYACFVREGQAEPRSQNNQLTWQQQLARLDHPVVNVSWAKAKDYAGWLAYTTGEPWRLPTEAEWEEAARWDPAARHARIYPWGDSFEQWRCNTSGSGKGTTTPVGAYVAGASPCGAQDMAGNVWEWASSLINPYPYTAGDGREVFGATGSRVLRGGSWRSGPLDARAAYRINDNLVNLSSAYGFRVVRAVPGVTPGR
jgi:formylglycine-generating enzyme required for sulfatase activity